MSKQFQEVFIMKKLTVFFCVLAGLFLFTLAGCANDDTFTKKSYASGGEIQKITIEVEDRELEIVASKDDEIRIEYFDGEKEYLEIVPENGQLTVRLVYNKNWTDYIGSKPSAK